MVFMTTFLFARVVVKRSVRTDLRHRDPFPGSRILSKKFR